MLGAQLLKCTSLADSFLRERIKTATDVLRLAVALSDGDISLAEPTKFLKFKRSERKWLLSRLEMAANPTEDMLRWQEPWKRLGERLHPGDYANQFPKAYSAFEVIRNDQPYPTFNRKIEKHLLEKNVSGILDLIGSRPGDLARRLDHLLRLESESGTVIGTFRDVADLVATPVLLQTLTHFRSRSGEHELRSFFPKGDVAKVYATTKKLPAMDPGFSGSVAQICEQTLLTRFSKLPPWANAISIQNWSITWCRSHSAPPARRFARSCEAAVCRCRRVMWCAFSSGGRMAAAGQTLISPPPCMVLISTTSTCCPTTI